MPGGDGTGPVGSGPNGWRTGPCGGSGTLVGGRRGYGTARGYGRGFGRGRLSQSIEEISDDRLGMLVREVNELRAELVDMRQLVQSQTDDPSA